MARVLAAQGERIGLLALLETVAMPAHLREYRYYLHRVACFARMTPPDWITYIREKIRYRRNAREANRMRFRQVERGGDQEKRDPRLVQLEHVYTTNLAALHKFRSRYYDGTVTLFNAAETDPALIPDREYGWVGLAKKIEIHEVPGNHDTMLTEPNVSVLAQRLNETLRHAQEKTSP
jgi:thioesterase domain-containing protein